MVEKLAAHLEIMDSTDRQATYCPQVTARKIANSEEGAASDGEVLEGEGCCQFEVLESSVLAAVKELASPKKAVMFSRS